MMGRFAVPWKLAGLALVVHAGCSIEGHPLSYGSLSSSASEGGTGSGSTGGRGGADSVAVGGALAEGGAPMDGGADNTGNSGPNGAGSTNVSTGGTKGESGGGASGGSGSTTAGSGGTAGSSGGTSAGGGGTAGSSGSTNVGGTGNGGSAGSTAGAGSGGVTDAGPCGDADRDGVQDCQETLAKNATFDRDINGWSPDFNVNQAWISDDAWKQPNSGSLSLTFTTQAGGQGWMSAAVSQCLPGWSGQNFEIGAHAFIVDGQSGNAQISLAMFGNDECAGSFLGTTTPAVAATTGSWQSLHASVQLEPGTRSVLVRLGATKPGSQTSLEIHFDDVLVRMK